jgi:CubicO group peptidase (beta-lactamase class C family)
MRTATAVVRGWTLDRVEGDQSSFHAASLVKPVVGHLALTVVPDLDEPLWSGISTRHILSHTTGLPNWRPPGADLTPIRPPGQQWGYSGEGFLLLQHAIERLTGQSIAQLARELVFVPLGMSNSRLDQPDESQHGLTPLTTTAHDYGLFLAHVLGLDDERWQVQCQIDEQLAWGAGWGLELGALRFVWQWGLNSDVSHFVIGCPGTGDGVAVFTDSADDGRAFYRKVVAEELPGHHPSLGVENNPAFLRLVQ